MKRTRIWILLAVFLCAGFGTWLIAADHIDAPAVTGQSTDITDLYVFRGENPDNIVFVANTQGLLSPAQTSAAGFDDNTLLEFNIDNNGDHVEDLVIQAVKKNGKIRIYGPYKPEVTGTTSYVVPNSFTAEAEITQYGEEPKITNQRGISVFAGPRDDPFFFDLTQFKKILAGQASGFNNPGHDSFAGTNVMSVVVEVPKSMLGSSNTMNVWLETKKKTGEIQ
jgi:hypothetical protein